MEKQLKGVIVHERMLQGDSVFDVPSVADYLPFYRQYPELLTADVDTFNTWDEEDRISGIVPGSMKEKADMYQVFSHEDWDASDAGNSIQTVLKELLPEYKIQTRPMECVPNGTGYEYTVIELWQ